MTFEERREVEERLEIAFSDIYDLLDGAHFEVRELEQALKHLFHGSASEGC